MQNSATDGLETVASRIAAGNRARKLFAEQQIESHAHFWETLANLVSTHIGKVVVEVSDDGPMSPLRALEFEQEVMPFGQYKGHKIVDVDLEYLVRLIDPSAFIRQLKKYIKFRML